MLRGIACTCVLVAATVAAGTAEAGPKMLKGPYLQDLAPKSITVMWQLDQPTAAKLIVEGPGGTRTQDVPASKLTEATVSNLQPSSRYRYRVEAGGESWTGEFATSPPDGTDVPHTFAVFGDSRYFVEQHRRVIQRVAQEVPDFVLGTGDMVDEGHRQDQWQQFFDVENEVLRDNVYFPALGNHDRQGRDRAAEAYRSYFSVPDNGNGSERYYAFTFATSRFLILDSNLYSFALTDQTAWLERQLIAARQDAGVHHIFVVMHHPPFSISLHGGAVELRDKWTPLFERYHVTAVFSGHDHVYERAEVNGIHYFVSGGGGAALYPRRPKSSAIDLAAVKKFERALHYLRVTVTGNRVEVSAIRADGSTIETTAFADGPDSPPPPKPSIASAGGPAPTLAAAAPASASPGAHPMSLSSPSDEDRGISLWLGLGALGLALGAAVFVVRSLRS